MRKLENNYAFIDSQNLNLGIRDLGWKLDYRKFRIYLKEKYAVKKAYIFIGFVALNQRLYDTLQDAEFQLVFKPTIPDLNGKIKGNVDADLVLKAMTEWNNYDKAVIVTNDGDFYSIVEHLLKQNKLLAVVSTNKKKSSVLLWRSAKNKMDFIDPLREKLEYRP